MTGEVEVLFIKTTERGKDKMFPDDYAQRTPEQQRDYRMSVRIATHSDINTMLVSRGYTLMQVISRDTPYTGMVEGRLPWQDKAGFTRDGFFLSFEYATLKEIEARIDCYLGAGMHHMCCSHCKEPIFVYKPVPTLADSACESGNPLRLRMGRMSNREYRAVASGPQSEPIAVCRGCGATLSEETIMEIGDA